MGAGIRLAAGVMIGGSVMAAAAAVAAQRPAVASVCAGGHRDDFNATELDRSRWTTVVRETPNLRVNDGHLVIPMTETDLLLPSSDDPSPTPNVVLQPLPEAPFTVTAKLALAPRRPFQQAGLVVYGDDDNYIKLVFQARGENDAESRHVEFLSDTKSQPGFTASTSPSLGAAYPDIIWLRLTSDGKTLRGQYSADGEQFTEVPETEGFEAPSLEGITAPKIGLLAMGGPTGIDAKFDWFELCPARAATGELHWTLGGPFRAGP